MNALRLPGGRARRSRTSGRKPIEVKTEKAQPKTAAKARDEAELYLLLADEIEDKEEKKAFGRKAVSISGKP